MASDTLKYKDFIGTVEYSAKNNALLGRVMVGGGFLFYTGKSVDEIRADFERVIDDYISKCEAAGVAPQKSYKGSFNVRIAPELHRTLAEYAVIKETSLNAVIEQALKEFVDRRKEASALE